MINVLMEAAGDGRKSLRMAERIQNLRNMVFLNIIKFQKQRNKGCAVTEREAYFPCLLALLLTRFGSVPVMDKFGMETLS